MNGAAKSLTATQRRVDTKGVAMVWPRFFGFATAALALSGCATGSHQLPFQHAPSTTVVARPAEPVTVAPTLSLSLSTPPSTVGAKSEAPRNAESHAADLAPPKKFVTPRATVIMLSPLFHAVPSSAPQAATRAHALSPAGTEALARETPPWVVISTAVTKHDACASIADRRHIQMRVRVCPESKPLE